MRKVGYSLQEKEGCFSSRLSLPTVKDSICCRYPLCFSLSGFQSSHSALLPHHHFAQFPVDDTRSSCRDRTMGTGSSVCGLRALNAMADPLLISFILKGSGCCTVQLDSLA